MLTILSSLHYYGTITNTVMIMCEASVQFITITTITSVSHYEHDNKKYKQFTKICFNAYDVFCNA